ncbi:M48 family metallopeptidase [Tundrisphaera sp. TA3]|uniref:M48 family metallopeptidase n=1 Tax=Tundrisphaera sp. TA3 TaxID=3435775 RepID=UPI003EBB7D6A
MTRTYKDITYKVARSDRKTASIYVERDGQVSVLVPSSLSEMQVESLIESKRPWIYKSLAEWHDLNSSRVQRAFVNGEGFPYLGRSYRLRLVDDQDQPLILKNGYFCHLRRGKLPSEGDFTATFEEFYRRKGLERLPKRVGIYESKMGVAAKAVKVFDLKNRWASCSPAGNLNFHWKCMMAPPTVLDYIVVHELAHLRFPNHTRAFWNEVDKILPDYRDRKRWLRVNGAGMDV